MDTQHTHAPKASTTSALILAAGLAIAPAGITLSQPDKSTPDTDRRSSLVQRGPVRGPANNGSRESEGHGNEAVARFPFEFRSITGLGTHPGHTDWGAAGYAMIRLAPAQYADGVGEPAGANRPSARAISNAVAATSGDTINTRGASSFLWQWGQFLDHDIDETPSSELSEPFDIAVPAGDPWFDPYATGQVVINLDRSHGEFASDLREQLNNITAYIDASNVYGSEDELAHWLRTNDGTGMLKTSEGDLLPYNTDGFHNAPSSADPSFFLAGDIRANEQIALTA
ncbi:MAG: peroxidase family protein, partial [Planctomycetota bacterium]